MKKKNLKFKDEEQIFSKTEDQNNILPLKIKWERG